MINGTVPLLPSDYLEQKLTQSQLTLLQMALDREAPNTPEVQTEIDRVLDALELTCVWGKRPDGYAQVRAFLVDGENMFVQCRVYSWDDMDVPKDVRGRKFTWADGPDQLFVSLLAVCDVHRKMVGPTLTLLAEDHPEMDAVGYHIAEMNETWLVKRSAIKAAVDGKATAHPEALQMFSTASGRRTLAKHLQDGTLTNVHTLERTTETPRGKVEARKAEQSLQIETMSSSMADRFMKRGK